MYEKYLIFCVTVTQISLHCFLIKGHSTIEAFDKTQTHCFANTQFEINRILYPIYDRTLVVCVIMRASEPLFDSAYPLRYFADPGSQLALMQPFI